MWRSFCSPEEHHCALPQVTKDMWHLFEQEFRSLWTAAAEKGSGGELALDVLYGPKAPAGAETLQVGMPELLPLSQSSVTLPQKVLRSWLHVPTGILSTYLTTCCWSATHEGLVQV